MNTILNDIRYQFKRGGNTLTQFILVNIAVYLLVNLVSVFAWLFGFGGMEALLVDYLGMPAYWLQFLQRPWTLVTYFFLHTGFWHIVGNMMFLYWFGSLITEYLGNKRIVALYFLGGLAGGLVYLLAYATLPALTPKAGITVLYGASGAVFAIVVAAAALLPHYTFHLLLIGPVKIMYIAGFYVLVSVFGLNGTNSGGNFAHLGGALIGYLFIQQLRRGNDWGKPILWVTDGIASFFKPSVRVTYTNSSRATTGAAAAAKKSSEQEIDSILDKINRTGYESLTREEKQKLFRASQND